MLPKVSVLGFVGPAMVSLSANFLLVVRIKVRNPFKANAGQLCGYWGEGWTVTTEVNSVRPIHNKKLNHPTHELSFRCLL